MKKQLFLLLLMPWSHLIASAQSSKSNKLAQLLALKSSPLIQATREIEDLTTSIQDLCATFWTDLVRIGTNKQLSFAEKNSNLIRQKKNVSTQIDNLLAMLNEYRSNFKTIHYNDNATAKKFYAALATAEYELNQFKEDTFSKIDEIMALNSNYQETASALPFQELSVAIKDVDTPKARRKASPNIKNKKHKKSQIQKKHRKKADAHLETEQN